MSHGHDKKNTFKAGPIIFWKPPPPSPGLSNLLKVQPCKLVRNLHVIFQSPVFLFTASQQPCRLIYSMSLASSPRLFCFFLPVGWGGCRHSFPSHFLLNPLSCSTASGYRMWPVFISLDLRPFMTDPYAWTSCGCLAPGPHAGRAALLQCRHHQHLPSC